MAVTAPSDAIALLKADHRKVEDLFAKFKAARGQFRNEAVQGTGGKQILLEDPSGNLIELFQPNTPDYRPPGSGSQAAQR